MRTLKLIDLIIQCDWICLCIIQIDNVHVWALFDELISEEGDLTSVFFKWLKRLWKASYSHLVDELAVYG